MSTWELACVPSVGDTFPTVTGSDPHPLPAMPLLASPLKLAVHSYVPVTMATYPVVVLTGPGVLIPFTVSV